MSFISFEMCILDGYELRVAATKKGIFLVPDTDIIDQH